MAFLFDKVNKYIFIETPGYGSLTVTIQELINSIRTWESSTEGMTEKSVANAYGKQDLGGGSLVGITLELINNWRIHFESVEVPTNAYIIGDNLVAINDYDNEPINPSLNISTVIAQSTSPIIPGMPWDSNIENYIKKGTMGEKMKKLAIRFPHD